MYRKLLPWHIDHKAATVALKPPRTPQNLGKHITLLSWNVHKNNHAFVWLEDFAGMLHRHRPDLILFQEYQTMNRKSVLDRHHEYGYGFFPNIVWKQNRFGLITASMGEIVDFDCYLTPDVEPIIKTPKVTLETSYRLENGQLLRVVNVHMINFVKIGKFLAQIGQIEKALAKEAGPLILSGDFNTWNRRRMQTLEKVCRAYGLGHVEFAEQKHRIAPFPYPLDHIFYRELSVQKSEVLHSVESSDHKPLLVTFGTK